MSPTERRDPIVTRVARLRSASRGHTGRRRTVTSDHANNNGRNIGSSDDTIEESSRNTCSSSPRSAQHPASLPSTRTAKSEASTAPNPDLHNAFYRAGSQRSEHCRIGPHLLRFQPLPSTIAPAATRSTTVSSCLPRFPAGGSLQPWIAHPRGGDLYFASLRFRSEPSINLPVNRSCPSSARFSGERQGRYAADRCRQPGSGRRGASAVGCRSQTGTPWAVRGDGTPRSAPASIIASTSGISLPCCNLPSKSIFSEFRHRPLQNDAGRMALRIPKVVQVALRKRTYNHQRRQPKLGS